MEINKQIELVSTLLDSVKAELVSRLEKGNVPNNWDGFELRWWAEEKLKEEANHAHKTYGKISKRWKDYENELIIRNL